MMKNPMSLLSVGAAALMLAACGGGGGGNTSADDSNASADAVFAKFDCSFAAEGPVAGPLDDAQMALIDRTASSLGDNEELGESAVAVITAVSRLLDVVDALAASGESLLVSQDPELASQDLLGATQALQCGAASLAEAGQASPLAALPEMDALLEDLKNLALALDAQDPATLGPEGIETLTARIADVVDTLSDLAAIAALDVGIPGASPELQQLLTVPSILLSDIADTLRAAGALDGEGVSAGLSASVVGVLEGLAALAPDNAAMEPLQQAEVALREGLGQLLVPLFDAIAGQLSDGGFQADAFADFLAGGFGGEIDFALAGAIAGADGFGTPPLAERLAGISVLGDILGQALSAEGVDIGDLEGGLPLISELLAAGGEGGLPTLLEALRSAADQLQSAGAGDALPGDAEGLLALLPQLGDGLDPLADTLRSVFSALASGDSSGLQGLLDRLAGLLAA
jgi:hypothetical protein